MAEPSTRTVERALALLATICERGGANLADSARDCDLAPSTALRLLRTLETTGFVSRDEAGGTYRPGARLIQLGAQALSQRVADRPRQADDGEGRRRNRRVGVPQRRGARRDRAVHRDRRGHALRPAHQLGRPNGAARQIGGRSSACAVDVPDAGYVVVERGVEADVTAIACSGVLRKRASSPR